MSINAKVRKQTTSKTFHASLKAPEYIKITESLAALCSSFPPILVRYSMKKSEMPVFWLPYYEILDNDFDLLHHKTGKQIYWKLEKQKNSGPGGKNNKVLEH